MTALNAKAAAGILESAHGKFFAHQVATGFRPGDMVCGTGTVHAFATRDAMEDFIETADFADGYETVRPLSQEHLIAEWDIRDIEAALRRAA